MSEDAKRGYTIEEMITGVQTLTLMPGDIVVILVSRILSGEEVQWIEQMLHRIFPTSVKVLVLDQGATIARVTVKEP